MPLCIYCDLPLGPRDPRYPKRHTSFHDCIARTRVAARAWQHVRDWLNGRPKDWRFHAAWAVAEYRGFTWYVGGQMRDGPVTMHMGKRDDDPFVWVGVGSDETSALEAAMNSRPKPISEVYQDDQRHD